jgi:hypothetical protein
MMYVYIDVDLGMAVSRHALESHPPLVVSGSSLAPCGTLPFLLPLPIGYGGGYLQPGLDRGATGADGAATTTLQNQGGVDSRWVKMAEALRACEIAARRTEARRRVIVLCCVGSWRSKE